MLAGLERCLLAVGQPIPDHLKTLVAAVFHRISLRGRLASRGSRRHAVRGREKGAVRMQCVRLNQQPLELRAIQQLAQRRDLTTGIGGVGALGNGQAQTVGVEAHLGDQTHYAGGGFIDRAPQGFAFRDQHVDGLCHAGPGRQPLLQQALKALRIQLGQQQPKRGVRWRLVAIGARVDSKSQSGLGSGCLIAIASSAVMSCITACMPARID